MDWRESMADSDGLEWARFEWLSFDCYGTLVDWETGISTAVGEVLDARGIGKSMNEILALFSDNEPRVQGSRPFLNYRRVLREVMEGIGTQLGFKCSESELDCLAETLPGWPVFPEAAGALEALKSRYRLAVISNVDDDLFAGTAKAVGVDFDAVVTAEQAGSYKPDLRNFSLASERMAVERQRWLHVAESLYHDIGPANRLGIKSVWVNRGDRGGATIRTEAVADLVVSSLSELADIACAALRREPP